MVGNKCESSHLLLPFFLPLSSMLHQLLFLLLQLLQSGRHGRQLLLRFLVGGRDGRTEFYQVFLLHSSNCSTPTHIWKMYPAAVTSVR